MPHSVAGAGAREQPPNESCDLTEALAGLAAGAPGADSRVMPLVYARLRELAERHLARERAGHTLQPTALVNEAYLKLIDQRVGRWESRAHFFAFAACSMRRILLDHAKSRARRKRGGGRQRIALELVDEATPGRAPALDLIALDDALDRFAAHDPLAARIVEMRFFAGMEIEAIARVLSVADRTVRRHWVYAKAWLGRELGRAERAAPAGGTSR